MRKWLPLTAVSLGTFMLLVDVTIVTVALPDMAGALHTGFTDLQWVLDIYALALAALLLGAGAVADRFGRRRIYVGGLVLFAAASLACGLAANGGQLILFRGVQGIGGAAMFATTMALLNTSYQGRDRGIAFGVWGAVSGAAAAAGPVVGGLLTEHLGWRWIFFINLPISVLAVLVTVRALRESRDPQAKGIDLPGLVTFTVAAGALTFALIRGAAEGWGSAPTLGLFALGAVALLGFVAVQLRSSKPMFDLSLLRNPGFTGVLAGALLLSAAAFSYLVYTSVWLQSVRGLGPVAAGLALVPMSVVAFVVSAVVGRRLHTASPRLTVGFGLLLVGSGALLLMLIGPGSSWPVLLPGLAVTGAGVGLATPAMAAAAMAAVPQRRSGMAGGALNTARQLGNALGIAVLGAVFQSGLEHRLRDGALPDAKGVADALAGGQADLVIGSAAPDRQADLAELVHQAFADGLRDSFLVSGVLGLLGAALVFTMVGRRRSAAAAPEAEPVREPVSA
ncbi:MFS transporter [Kitasatospora sp. NPDC092948]|uniref:MFS transporter n=1 Tax=Kitasatospora sp. NPDC092948 TaxID=3364088 RepID=UPI00381122A2